MSERREQQLDPRLILKAAHATAGLAWFITEAGRNALVHGKAAQVRLTVGRLRPEDPEPVLEILDDGQGMDKTARTNAGQRLGMSSIGTNGAGLRLTASTLAQYLQFHTVTEEEPEVVYTITLPIIQFVCEVCAGTWRGEWERVPRNRSRFPRELRHGTLVVLYDFRAADPRDPLDTRLLRGTRAQITASNMVRHITRMFPPDQSRLFSVNGTRVQPKPYEGNLLWKQTVATRSGIGKLSGEIRLPETASAAWMLIGGTTATIPMAEFIKDFEEHNEELAAKIPPVFRDKRLTGIVRLEVLERFPTPDRAHLLSPFYTGEEGVVVVDELVRIGDKVTAALREYDDAPHSHVTESLLAELIANLNASQGITPGSAPGDGPGPGPAPTPVPVLRVEPPSLHLDPWKGTGKRDESQVAVQNPLPDEGFTWEVMGDPDILAQTAGVQVTVRAVSSVGTHLLKVSSTLHPRRTASVTVQVKHQIIIPDNADKTFLLVPLSTHVVVGQERRIQINKPGTTRPPYSWSVERAAGGKRGRARFEASSDGTYGSFLAQDPGAYTVSCRCDKTGEVATCSVEVRVRAPETDPVPPPIPTPPAGDPPGGPGTGDPVRERPSHLTGLLLRFRFRGEIHEFRLQADATLRDPFFVDPDNAMVRVSDRVLGRFEAPEAQRRHVASCASDGIGLVFLDRGVLEHSDYGGFAELSLEILEHGMLRKVPAK